MTNGNGIVRGGMECYGNITNS